MELTISIAQLIGQVDIHLANLETYTTGKALGILPVYIISCRSIHSTWAVDSHVANTIHLVTAGDVVVTYAECYIRYGLVLSTQLQG